MMSKLKAYILGFYFHSGNNFQNIFQIKSLTMAIFIQLPLFRLFKRTLEWNICITLPARNFIILN